MTKIKIVWTVSAIAEIRNIHQYYKDKASISVAQKIVNGVIDHADVLKTQPNSGQEELTLKSLGQGHRYLVKGHFKIIYRITDSSAFITDVFDSRQDPEKLKKRNS